MTKDILVARILGDKSFFLPRSKGFGRVDFRPMKYELPSETHALQCSLQTFGISTNIDMCPRLVTIVSSDDIKQALHKAELLFEEALDAYEWDTPGIGKNILLPAGYYIDLTDGISIPIVPTAGFGPFPLFHIIEELFPQIDKSQFVLGHPDNELVLRIRRASYWARKAKQEASAQTKALYRWIAIEALCKTKSKDDIIPKIQMGLGFLTSTVGKAFKDQDRASIAGHPAYRKWKRWTERILKKMRVHRGYLVHEAYRPHDIDPNIIKNFNKIAFWVFPRLRSYAINALLQQIETITEFWRVMPILMREKANLQNDLHNNILFLLENPSNIPNGMDDY